MCEKVNFNVIEKNKTKDKKDVIKYINDIVNNLITKEFVRKIWLSYFILL